MPLVARLVLLVVIAVLPALAIQLYNEYDLCRAREAQSRVPPGWSIASDMATPLALIANERVMNALKHAFLPGRCGIVTIRCATTPDGTTILAR